MVIVDGVNVFVKSCSLDATMKSNEMQGLSFMFSKNGAVLICEKGWCDHSDYIQQMGWAYGNTRETF